MMAMLRGEEDGVMFARIEQLSMSILCAARGL